MKPTIGRVVIYRSRTGHYSVPAIVNATEETLWVGGVERYEQTEGAEGVPPLSGPENVHLTVLTPGLPGCRVDAEDFKVEGVRRAENVGGLYQEWDVPPDPEQPAIHGASNRALSPQEPGTWRWPERV